MRTHPILANTSFSRFPSPDIQASWCSVPVWCFLPHLISFVFPSFSCQHNRIFISNLLCVSSYKHGPSHSSSALRCRCPPCCWVVIGADFCFYRFPPCMALNSCFSPSHERKYFKECSSSVLVYLRANSVLP